MWEKNAEIVFERFVVDNKHPKKYLFYVNGLECQVKDMSIRKPRIQKHLSHDLNQDCL